MGDDRSRPGIPCAPGAASSRRRHLAWTAVACALLAVATVLAVRGGPVADPAPAAAAPAPAAPPSLPGAAPVDVLGLPTRGPLAADAAFLGAVAQRPWTGSSPDPGRARLEPPAGLRRVVFAGDVPGGRWALVAGPDPLTGSLVTAWFTGPPGAPAESMQLRSVPRGVSAERPAALLDPLVGVLVVVTAPGDVVEVSDHPVIAGDGSVGRTYRPVAAPDGVAVVDLAPTELPSVSAVAYRVVRDGTLLVRTKPDPFPDPAAPPPGPVAIDHWRGPPSAAGEQVAQRAATTVLARLGVPRAQVEVAAPWVGDVPPGGTEAQPAAVVTVTLPSGAVVVAAEWGRDPAEGGLCALAVQPAGFALDRRVQALSCGARDGTSRWSTRDWLVVVGPPTVVTVRAYSGSGDFLAEHPAADGVAVVPFPRGTVTVEAVTAGGVQLGRVRLLGHAADFGS